MRIFLKLEIVSLPVKFLSLLIIDKSKIVIELQKSESYWATAKKAEGGIFDKLGNGFQITCEADKTNDVLIHGKNMKISDCIDNNGNGTVSKFTLQFLKKKIQRIFLIFFRI